MMIVKGKYMKENINNREETIEFQEMPKINNHILRNLKYYLLREPNFRSENVFLANYIKILKHY